MRVRYAAGRAAPRGDKWWSGRLPNQLPTGQGKRAGHVSFSFAHHNTTRRRLGPPFVRDTHPPRTTRAHAPRAALGHSPVAPRQKEPARVSRSRSHRRRSHRRLRRVQGWQRELVADYDEGARVRAGSHRRTHGRNLRSSRPALIHRVQVDTSSTHTAAVEEHTLGIGLNASNSGEEAFEIGRVARARRHDSPRAMLLRDCD